MGADIYHYKRHAEHAEKVKPLFDAAVINRDKYEAGTPQQKKAQKRVTELCDEMYSVGYFRDSYNDSSLLWQLDLSWWKDIGKMLDDEGMLSVEGVKKLRRMVQRRRRKLEAKLETMTADDQKYFHAKYDQFIKFLTEAIEHDIPLECSI